MPKTRVLLNFKAHDLGWLKIKKNEKSTVGKNKLTTLQTTKKLTAVFYK